MKQDAIDRAAHRASELEGGLVLQPGVNVDVNEPGSKSASIGDAGQAGTEVSRSQPGARTAADAELDLTSCDREPIHIPGSIQPHGFLLALDPETLAVREASENAAGYLGVPPASVFGRTLPELLGQEHGRRLEAELSGDKASGTPKLLARVSLAEGAPRRWEVVAHRAGAAPVPGAVSKRSPSADGGERPEGSHAAIEAGSDGSPGGTQDHSPGRGRNRDQKRKPDRIIVEFEPSFEEGDMIDMEAINSRLYNFISANRGRREADAVMQAAVTELRTLTGCDRVVLYSFDEEGHGLVLAEDRGEQFASYLGLRFPASDVPKQARRLYELNRVRIIPNVDYEPSPLVSAGSANEAAELDLSASLLRSVSPVHRAYMRNMGTACSMSVSIMIDGKLWGLVSCHHHVAHYVPLRLRSACDFVMQVVSAQIESEQNRQHLERVLHARTVQGRLLAAMAASENYMDGLLAEPALLMEMVHADGAAVVVGTTVHLFGMTPNRAEVAALTEWLEGETFVSSRLSEQYPAGAAFCAAASGVIAASLSKLQQTLVLWFRQELISTVRWAGDPHKPALPEGEQPIAPGVTVSPRHSFEEWSQIVRSRCVPWSQEDIDAVAEFRSSVLEIVLKRAEEMAEMAAGLKIANEELEAFSYSVSHDLRAPFRHISGFSEMLREQEAGRLSEKGERYLSTIMDSARFAGLLVDSLLDFSRIARTRMHRASVDMERLFDEEWAAVLSDEGKGREDRILLNRGPLPRVLGDAHLLRQVVRNLLSNAVKYTGKVEQASIEAGARMEGQELIFFVRDNGVGFDQQYAGKLFGVFQRLHRAEDFEGTGIGLANVRRIITRHGGRTWAESELGKGATFYFSMPLSSSQEGH